MRVRYSTAKDGKLVKKALVYTREEHGITRKDVDADAVEIIERLHRNGYNAYLVGGAVRDLALKMKPKDFDIVTNAVPHDIKRMFRSARIIGNRFRLVHVTVGSKIFEVCTFRSLINGTTSNTFGDIEDDVLRRDFTLNALFYDPREEIVVDYVGGMKDIWEKRIKPIIPLTSIFVDDPVRMIRAVKYAATTGFKLPLQIQRKIRQQADLLDKISRSRLMEELLKVIHSHCAADIVQGLDENGLFKYLQPNAAELMQSNPGFRNQYLKTLGTINQSEKPDPPGTDAAALIRDYLEERTIWDSNEEHIKNAFSEARQFILPLNLPRVDFENAIRLIFRAHSITIKGEIIPEHEHPRKPFPPEKKTPLIEQNTHPHFRKRRPRYRKNKQ
ncbi:polynucleotide adenylyltransferase [Spirochaetia bacterium]|nr:polynucleotide adenylyltransferase [Spirochaetia bacterium]GHU34712.1 polynucleotide adenylyltransferase [Spirochaetia bacterium]